MSRTSSPAGTVRRGRILAVVATLIAPGLLYLVLRGAAAALSPPAAAALPPRNYAPALRPLVLALADPRVRLPQQVLPLAQRAAVTAPLAYEPYFLASKQAAEQKDMKSAIALMEEARRRRPNSLVTRLQLMSYYGSVGRFRELLGEMNFILRSSPAARQHILPELVKLIRDPAGRRALASLLAKNPDWRQDFFKVAQEHRVQPEDARELMELVRAAGARGSLAPERGLYLQTLLKAGQNVRARSLWLQAFPQSERARHTFLFNGEFRDVKALPPFNWELSDRDVGRAEIVGAANPPYLNAEFFGGKNAVLAEQLLALAPGRYGLAFAAKSESGIASGGLFWAIACLPAGREVARIPVANLQPTYRSMRSGFQIPAGCTGQRLSLVAEAGDISRPFDAQIANLQVVPQ